MIKGTRICDPEVKICTDLVEPRVDKQFRLHKLP